MIKIVIRKQKIVMKFIFLNRDSQCLSEINIKLIFRNFPKFYSASNREKNFQDPLKIIFIHFLRRTRQAARPGLNVFAFLNFH